MFTKNWYCFCAISRVGDIAAKIWDSIVAWNGETIKTHDGYTDYYWTSYNLSSLMDNHLKISKSSIPSMKSNSHWTNYGVCFGSGTTPATVDDYCMEGDLFTTYNHSQVRALTKDSVSYTYTLTNTGTEDFTIGEVGLIGYATDHKRYNYNDYYYGSGVLLERTVLESPITIPANGGVGQIAYTLKMDGLE